MKLFNSVEMVRYFMQCFNPIVLKNRFNKTLNPLCTPIGYEVPCGKCLACHIARAREWSTRVVHELESWDESCFITLTYNDKNIPPNYSLRKKDLQDFWKRLRKRLGKDRRIKYYACGEYGDMYNRPHLHSIIFGLSLKEHEVYKIKKYFYVKKGPLIDCWDKGYIQIGDVTFDSARYVAQYIDKKLVHDEAKKAYEDKGREPPFQCCSQGLGLQFAIKNEARMRYYKHLTIQGNPVSIPRYYLKKLKIDTSDFFKEEKRERIRQLYDKFKLNGITDYAEIYKKLCEAKKVNKVNLEGQIKLLHDRRKKL